MNFEKLWKQIKPYVMRRETAVFLLVFSLFFLLGKWDLEIAIGAGLIMALAYFLYPKAFGEPPKDQKESSP